MGDQQYGLAVPEQQPTVAHTYELSLPIKLLPGEDDVKLREGKDETLDLEHFSSQYSCYRYHLLYA